MTFKENGVERKRAKGEKTGRVQLWCETCKGFVFIDEQTYDGKCPECGQPIFKMRCTRCDKTWYPRDPMMLPGTCPGCKTPYWNRERTKSNAKKKVPKVDPELAALLERNIAKAQAEAEKKEVVRI